MGFAQSALLATNSTRNMQLYPVQAAYSVCTTHSVLCTCKTERQRERVYVLFPEKLFYPTHTINQSQTKQPLSNKDVLLPPPCWHTYTHTQLQMLTHSFTYTIRVFCLSPSVPGGLNEMRQKRTAVREKESFCWWRAAFLSHPCADGPCCCTSGHMPREQQQQSCVRWGL